MVAHAGCGRIGIKAFWSKVSIYLLVCFLIKNRKKKKKKKKKMSAERLRGKGKQACEPVL